MQESVKQKLITRLSGYWKMEAGNMLLLPAFVLYLTKLQISLWTVVAIIAVVVLLGVGALYWRIKLHQFQGNTERFKPTMVLIKRLQLPSLVLTLISLGLCGLLWLRPDFSKGLPDQIAISAMAVLAALEYVNYYHRQLNYFDNKADLKRVFSGNGFRTSKMRHDLNELECEK